MDGDKRFPVPRRRTVSSARPRGHGWLVATGIVLAALVLAAVLPRLEYHEHWRPGFSFSPSTAQAALAAMAGGMLTLVGFALAAVTLMVQTVQAQSPRLLHALDRLEDIPILFGTSIAAFIFALAVLTDVRANSAPTISVSLAILFVVASVCMFLRLLVGFRSTLTTGGLAREVSRETRAAIDERFPAPFQASAPQARPPADTADQGSTWTVRHDGEPGVYQGFDEPALLRLATSLDTEITLVPAIGDFVGWGAVLAHGPGNPPSRKQLLSAVRISPSRSLAHDPAYGLRLLADISIRALSPAVNDPTSAVQAMDQVDDILHRLAARSLGTGTVTGPDGRPRVRYPPPAWDALVALGLDETMQYGASSLQVARRLQALLTDLVAAAPRQRRPPVQARIEALRQVVTAAFPDAGGREAASPDRQGLGTPAR